MFPNLFQGLIRTVYHIQLREGAKLYALNMLKRMANPSLPQVEAKLKRMEQLGEIVPVKEPTEWRSGMVVVPKLNGQVCICVDLTKLNESMKRKRHSLQDVDQTLSGAKIFTKLDTNSGFW